VKRVLLIGIGGLNQSNEKFDLRSVPWDKVQSIENVGDFHDIIVNLPTFPREGIGRPAFDHLFNHQNLEELLGHGGRLVIVGDPRTRIYDNDNEGTLLDWASISAEWSSKTVTVDDYDYSVSGDGSKWGAYLDDIEKNHYSLVRIAPDLETLAEHLGVSELVEWDPNFSLDVEQINLLSSRTKTMIAGYLSVRIIKTDNYYNSYETHRRLGTIVLLPETAKSNEESLGILLQSLYQFEGRTAEPDWSASIVAPGQAEIDRTIEELEENYRELNRLYDEAQSARKRVRAPLALLYGHDKGLEVAVVDALRVLGADVDVPEETNRTDGLIAFVLAGQLHHAVLEVKSKTKGQFEESALRQLDDWHADALSDPGVKAKKLFVGNASFDMPPDERPDPFGKNWIKRAERGEVVALRSEDLYAIICAVNDGTFSPDDLWQSLFVTNGVLPVKQLFSAKTNPKDFQGCIPSGDAVESPIGGQ
jgi:hypothetical protein